MKKVILKIDIDELIYDIQNKTYLTGRSRGDGTNHRHVALMQANNDDENLNQIMRSIGNAFARIRTELSEVLEEKLTSADNTLVLSHEGMDFPLSMPDNFNTAATGALASAIHQYIVAVATAEWFMITNKTDSEDYNKLAETSVEMLRQTLCKRERPSRKSPYDESLPEAASGSGSDNAEKTA